MKGGLLVNNHDLRLKLEEFQNGNKDAFFIIYEELKTPIYTIIYRILYDPKMSEDVMQDIFLRIFETPPLPHIEKHRAWIFQMARNLALDCKRKVRENKELSDEMETSESLLENVVATRVDIESALRHLSLEDREIVTLRLNAALKFREIAEVVNKPLGTTLWRYQKAIGTLRLFLTGGKQ